MAKATLIHGKQGAGKSLFARRLAGKFQHPIELDAERLFSKFGMSLIPDNADVVIVDECAARHAAALKRMTSSDLIVINPKGKASYRRMPPTIIACTTDDELLALAGISRRFDLVRLPA